MTHLYLPGVLSTDDIKKFLHECHNHYPYLFDLDYVDSWSDKLSKFARCVCIKADDAIRSACLYYCNRQTETAYITLIAVHPDAEHGSGYELFCACRRDAKECGMKKIQLEVLKNNSHARIFYLRQGFVDIAEHGDKLLMEMRIE